MAISPQLVGAGLSMASGLFGGGGPDPVQFNPMDVTGGVGTAQFQDGGIQLGLSPQAQGLQTQMFGGAGNIFGQLSDPSQVSQDFFTRGMGLMAPGQQQARTSLENRLFAQGRLGSTGGAQQFGGLLQGQNMAQQQLAQQAIFRGTQQRGMEIGQGLQLFGGGMQIDQASMDAARLGLQGGQGQLQADMFNASQPQGMDPMQAALLSAGGAVGGMSSFSGGGGGGGGFNTPGVGGYNLGQTNFAPPQLFMQNPYG